MTIDEARHCIGERVTVERSDGWNRHGKLLAVGKALLRVALEGAPSPTKHRPEHCYVWRRQTFVVAHHDARASEWRFYDER